MDDESATDTLALLPATEVLPAVVEPRVGGIRKAAVLMAALGSERAAKLMQRMGEQEIESLSMEMASLNSVGPETTEAVFNELAALSGAGEQGTSGGMEYARGVIERALGPERAAEVLSRLTASTETPPSISSSGSRPSAPPRSCAASRRRRSP